MKKEKRILVVDDDENIRQIIQLVLESEGYAVTGLENGHGVFEAVARVKPDLVLLDVMLGDMNGRDICQELKNKTATAEIPVIMISASQNWRSQTEASCHADHYMNKPFDIDELIANVGRYAA